MKRRPRVDGDEIADDESHVGAAPGVAELLAHGHVAAGVTTDHDGLCFGIIENPYRHHMRPAIGTNGREAPQRLAAHLADCLQVSEKRCVALDVRKYGGRTSSWGEV